MTAVVYLGHVLFISPTYDVAFVLLIKSFTGAIFIGVA